MNRIEPHITSFGATDRRDAWWIYPLMTGLGLLGFVLYASYAGMSNAHYEYANYLSPFYSPLIKPSWLPWFVSPAALILVFPAGFRATCYYYRKAYYRSFFFHPPGCAVGEGRSHRYSGERAFPWVLQNMHRFFLYAAIVFIGILAYDVWLATFFPFAADGTLVQGVHGSALAHDSVAVWKRGFGLGTLVLLTNVILLACYTFGCHSLRHLVGGKHDCFSCLVSGGPQEPMSFKAWKGVSWLNKRHQMFAWLSLFSVGLADLYIRLASMGFFRDPFFTF
jgi:hypothetical protein